MINKKRKIVIITCGGTIAKTYTEVTAVLENVRPVVEDIVASMRLPYLDISYNHLMRKDSLDMDDNDRAAVLTAVKQALETGAEGVVVVQGTDTLSLTGETIFQAIRNPEIPIVLTGAMRPYVVQGSDAAQNIAETLFSFHFLKPGVYAVMHGKMCVFPGVIKDRATMTFTNV